MTNIALPAMLGGTPPAGYESLYFDRSARELRGGVSKYIGRRTPNSFPASYMESLDYQEPLAFEFLVYVAPERVWRADMRRFRERFHAAPPRRDYFAFLKGTDGLLHIRGEAKLAIALESLDRILNEIQIVCGRETEIVLFSDHGMNLQRNLRVSLRTHLTRRGFAFAGRLTGATPKSLTVPAFGLCSYAALYCGDMDSVPDVAAALVELEGVDFSLYADGANAVILKGPNGAARIERREIEKGAGANGSNLNSSPRRVISFRYVPREGDPLQLRTIQARLAMEGKLDANGFAADEDWRDITADHIYPDSLSNLYASLHTPRVRHTADVLVSFQDGYYYGWSPFARMVPLAATHGNALRPSSNAFLMSTHRDLPAYVRADDAQPLLRA